MKADRRQFNGRTPAGTPVSERFWSKVIGGDVDHCWLWNGCRDPKGYGMFQASRLKLVRAHRWAYEALRGEIPNGLHLDHLCRHPSCVNPWHLEPVSCRENVLRGFGSGATALRRTCCIRGHDYATHGVRRSGRRVCRECLMTYGRLYRLLPQSEIQHRKSLGLPVVDLDAYYLERTAA